MGVFTGLEPAEELAFFRQLWLHSSKPFWLCKVVADDFLVVAVNPTQERLDPRFQVAASLRNVFGHGQDADELLSGYYSCRDTGKPLTFDQKPVVNGQLMAFQTLLVPVKDDQGVVTHIWGSAADLTGFLQVQKALRAMTSELEQRVHARTEELNKANAKLTAANEKLATLALRDSLTGLFNRFHFFTVADAEIERAIRYTRPLAILMIDVDHFKQINDQHGHAVGDRVLVDLAAIMSEQLRVNDIAARIGGEEFAIVLPETDLDEATSFAQRLRAAIAASEIEAQRITVSIGVAQLGIDQINTKQVLTCADAAMYRAKRSGRNRVEVSY